jgi:hypothetical protein
MSAGVAEPATDEGTRMARADWLTPVTDLWQNITHLLWPLSAAERLRERIRRLDQRLAELTARLPVRAAAGGATYAAALERLRGLHRRREELRRGLS